MAFESLNVIQLHQLQIELTSLQIDNSDFIFSFFTCGSNTILFASQI